MALFIVIHAGLIINDAIIQVLPNFDKQVQQTSINMATPVNYLNYRGRVGSFLMMEKHFPEARLQAQNKKHSHSP